MVGPANRPKTGGQTSLTRRKKRIGLVVLRRTVSLLRQTIRPQRTSCCGRDNVAFADAVLLLDAEQVCLAESPRAIFCEPGGARLKTESQRENQSQISLEVLWLRAAKVAAGELAKSPDVICDNRCCVCGAVCERCCLDLVAICAVCKSRAELVGHSYLWFALKLFVARGYLVYDLALLTLDFARQ